MLGLQQGGEHEIEALPQHILEQHFGEYSASRKAYHTHGVPNEFFGNLVHFFLEFICIHANAYNMPKKRAGLIIMAYRGSAINWGIITEEGIRAAILAFQTSKRFLPAFAHHLVLVAPKMSPTKKRCRLHRLSEEQTTEDWQLVIVLDMAVTVVTDKTLALIGHIEQG